MVKHARPPGVSIGLSRLHHQRVHPSRYLLDSECDSKRRDKTQLGTGGAQLLEMIFDFGEHLRVDHVLLVLLRKTENESGIV